MKRKKRERETEREMSPSEGMKYGEKLRHIAMSILQLTDSRLINTVCFGFLFEVTRNFLPSEQSHVRDHQKRIENKNACLSLIISTVLVKFM